MKPQKPPKAEKEKTPAKPPEFWRPDWRWHAKALLGIYVFLAVAYFALSAFLSRVPEPHRMRDIPKEMTPWLKR
jgi:hypothetical protein